MSREDLWLHDNQGYPILNKNKPILDFIQAEARDLWKSGKMHWLYEPLINLRFDSFQPLYQFSKPQEAGLMGSLLTELTI